VDFIDPVLSLVSKAGIASSRNASSRSVSSCHASRASVTYKASVAYTNC
jgi:hypothetical protein